MNSDRITPQPHVLEKIPTGIEEFDGITGGGLPRNRTSLVIGGAGTGKTVFALQTLVNGVHRWGEPGIFVACEENSRQVIANAESFGWDLPTLERDGKLFFLDAHLSVDDTQSGKFDLVGMLASLKAKADEMGAKRIVFDSLDVLLTSLDDPIAERREIYRLRNWLSQDYLMGIVVIRIGESDPLLSQLYSFLQFTADCVVLLRHYVAERVSLRELRVVKYRGSNFAEGEFPLVIGPQGIEVFSFGPEDPGAEASTERLSSGIKRLDAMLNGGYYRGSCVLITGAPGTAKSTLGAVFAETACCRGEKTLYISFDERVSELVRNLSSVGIHLGPHLESGVLRIYAERVEGRSAEEHLAKIKALIRRQKTRCLVIDPLSAMIKAGGSIPALGVAKELLHSAKAEAVTTVFTSLKEESAPLIETPGVAISTIADTWLNLCFLAKGGERNRTLTIVKSRGSSHSNQVRELLLSDQGVTLEDVYTAGGEVLLGTMRWERERAEALDKERSRAETERRQRELKLSEEEMLGRMEVIKHQLESQREDLALLIAQQKDQNEDWQTWQKELLDLRGGDKDA